MAPDRSRGGTQIHVLHVEEEENQLVSKLSLERADPSLRVTSVKDPAQALRLVEDSLYECLVADYSLPDMDGVSLAKRVREISDISLIIYTGEGSEEAAEAAFAAGVDDYVRIGPEPSTHMILAHMIRSSVEMRRAEKRLRDLKRELDWMAENTSDAVFRLEFDKGVTRHNPAFAMLYGPVSAEPTPIQELTPSRASYVECPRLREIAENALKRKKTQSKLVHRWLTHGGEELWLETNLSAILRDGEVAGFDGTSRDITDSVRLETELRRSRESLHRFIDSADDVIILLDTELKITDVNEAGLEVWGKSRDQVIGRRVHEIGSGIMGSLMHDKLLGVLETGEAQNYEESVSCGEADRHVKYKVFKTPEGLGVIAVDATEKMRFQRELEESEKKLRILVDNIPEVFYISGDQGMVFVGPNVVNMTWYNADEVTKPDPGFWYTLIYHEDEERVREARRRHLEEDEPYDVEYRVQRRDGALIWVRDQATQRYTVDGATYCDGKLSNITERKLMEKGLKGYVEHLEQMVADLKNYSQRLEEMLKERNQLLVDAERDIAVGQVASMVGHDLRSPLQTINNAVYLMQRHPERQPELVKTVQGSVKYAVKILEDIRNATKDSPLEVEAVNLAELIELAVREAPIPEHVTLEKRLGEGVERVYLDRVKIRRVLDNLIRNACEAMKSEGTITVVSSVVGDDLVIEVEDTGIGIPEEFIPDLFQTYKTTKKKGLGLGLAYSKKAVDAHRGRITVESEADKGTRFRIVIPQKRYVDVDAAGSQKEVAAVRDSEPG